MYMCTFISSDVIIVHRIQYIICKLIQNNRMVIRKQLTKTLAKYQWDSTEGVEVKKYYVCSRDISELQWDSPVFRPKKEYQIVRRQPTFCMQNLEVGDRRLRCHLALPSPMEIISTRADGTSIAASHTVLRPEHGWETVRVGTCWQSKHAFATERMDLSITNVKPILLFPRFYFAYEARV